MNHHKNYDQTRPSSPDAPRSPSSPGQRALLALVAASGLLACAPHPAPPPPGLPPAAAPTATVERAALPPVVLAGVTAPAHRIELSFRSGGVVQAVSVEDGATVKRGQVLARLDPTELAAGVRQAEEGVARAQRTAARARVLAEGRAGNRADAEDAATAVAVAEAQLAQAAFVRDRGVITAPVDGRVERRLADPGEVVGPGQPILVIAQRGSALAARALIDDRSLACVELGTVATARIDGAEQTGAVTRIGSAALAGGQVELELSFTRATAAQDREPPLGVPVRITVTPTRTALLVPALAIVDADDAGLARVYVRDAPNTLRATAVRVVAVRDGNAYVEPATPDALDAGAVLALPGARAL